MEYRINKRTGDKISVLGFGTSYIAEAKETEAVRTICRAYEGGVNYHEKFCYFRQRAGGDVC